jgi:hypothetical protein
MSTMLPQRLVLLMDDDAINISDHFIVSIMFAVDCLLPIVPLIPGSEV